AGAIELFQTRLAMFGFNHLMASTLQRYSSNGSKAGGVINDKDKAEGFHPQGYRLLECTLEGHAFKTTTVGCCSLFVSSCRGQVRKTPSEPSTAASAQ
ncbi:MAG: hypothetical protein RIS44_3160, partial [Pseudomonadota bacterium]